MSAASILSLLSLALIRYQLQTVIHLSGRCCLLKTFGLRTSAGTHHQVAPFINCDSPTWWSEGRRAVLGQYRRAVQLDARIKLLPAVDRNAAGAPADVRPCQMRS